jgi:hypothetical protein
MMLEQLRHHERVAFGAVAVPHHHTSWFLPELEETPVFE